MNSFLIVILLILVPSSIFCRNIFLSSEEEDLVRCADSSEEIKRPETPLTSIESVKSKEVGLGGFLDGSWESNFMLGLLALDVNENSEEVKLVECEDGSRRSKCPETPAINEVSGNKIDLIDCPDGSQHIGCSKSPVTIDGSVKSEEVDLGGFLDGSWESNFMLGLLALDVNENSEEVKLVECEDGSRRSKCPETPAITEVSGNKIDFIDCPDGSQHIGCSKSPITMGGSVDSEEVDLGGFLDGSWESNFMLGLLALDVNENSEEVKLVECEDGSRRSKCPGTPAINEVSGNKIDFIDCDGAQHIGCSKSPITMGGSVDSEDVDLGGFLDYLWESNNISGRLEPNANEKIEEVKLEGCEDGSRRSKCPETPAINEVNENKIDFIYCPDGSQHIGCSKSPITMGGSVDSDEVDLGGFLDYLWESNYISGRLDPNTNDKGEEVKLEECEDGSLRSKCPESRTISERKQEDVLIYCPDGLWRLQCLETSQDIVNSEEAYFFL